MSTLLSKIQDTVIKYADVIAQILKVDVEIMDSNFVRLAGTGEYRRAINKCMKEEGKVYNAVLESGETQIIKKPGEHILCSTCPKRESCLEKFEACTPIKLNNKVIGVIGLICFKEEQREYLMTNLNTYINFLEQMADLISAKAYEKNESESIIKRVNLLNEIIDKLEHGVIILDIHGHISHMNRNAQKILKANNYREKRVKLVPTGNNFLDQQEYRVKLDNREFNLMGKVYTVDLNEERYDRMFIFDETSTINNLINKITNLEYNITLKIF